MLPISYGVVFFLSHCSLEHLLVIRLFINHRWSYRILTVYNGNDLLELGILLTRLAIGPTLAEFLSRRLLSCNDVTLTMLEQYYTTYELYVYDGLQNL